MKSVRFPFVAAGGGRSTAVLMPILPLTLRLDNRQIEIQALADTGSSLNVLPWSAGISLGASWEKLDTPLKLTGNLSSAEARALVVEGVVIGLSAVRLVFAWTRSDAIPVLLGQVNFFMEFDVSFFRKSGVFEVTPSN
jgi:hypothetical protein